MITREDFKGDLSLPTSIADMVAGQLDFNRPNNPLDKESMDDIMKRVYAHIETEALRLYKSNEPWAIREYVVENILKEPIASEDNVRVASELSEPVEKWQQESFDPLSQMRLKLEVSGRKRGYIREVMRVAKWFVADAGRKSRYGEGEILQFVRKLATRYDKRDDRGNIITEGRDTSTFCTKIANFKRFLDLLPVDEVTGRKQTIPFQLPSPPEEYNRPVLSTEDIELLIYKALTVRSPVRALRLALSTIYGCRVGEIANMDSSNINLEEMTVAIPTEKKGQRKPQPIPETLRPLFSVPLKKCAAISVNDGLKSLCRSCNIPWQKGMGTHSIRRAVVTALYQDTDVKELHIKRFMRWSEKGRGTGVMNRYIRVPVEVTDAEVLERHPFVKIWEQMLPMIECNVRWNKSSNVQLYNILRVDTM